MNRNQADVGLMFDEHWIALRNPVQMTDENYSMYTETSWKDNIGTRSFAWNHHSLNYGKYTFKYLSV